MEVTDTGQGGPSCADTTVADLGISDAFSSTWSMVSTGVNWNVSSPNDCVYVLYTTVDVASGQDVDTVISPTNGLTAAQATWVAIDVVGADAEGPVDGSTFGWDGGSVGTSPGATFSTNQANDLALGFLATSYPANPTASSGWTAGVLESSDSQGTSELDLQYTTFTGAGSYSWDPPQHNPMAPWAAMAVPLAPNIALITPSTPAPGNLAIDQGQSEVAVEVTLPATLGGYPTYTLTWLVSVGGGSYGEATSNDCTYNTGPVSPGQIAECVPGATVTPGTYTYELELTDSNNPATTTTSNPSGPVVINSQLLPPSAPTVPGSEVDSDQSVSVYDDLPTTGTADYGWLWLVNVNGGGFLNWGTDYCAVNSGSGGTAGTQETCSIGAGALTPTDTYAFKLQVTDSASQPATVTSGTSATITDHTQLQPPTAPTVTSTILDDDQGLTVQTDLPTTGSPTYGWLWLESVDGGPIVEAGVCLTMTGSGGTSGEQVTCAVNGGVLVVGDTYAFYLQVSDSAASSETVTSGVSSTVMVNSALTAPSVPGVSSSALDVNQPLTVTSTLPSGTGTIDYGYTWWISINGGTYAMATGFCSVASAPDGSQAPSTTETCSVPAGTLVVGTYAFELEVVDFATVHDTKFSAPSGVVQAASALAPATPTLSASALDVDQTFTATASLTGGTPTYGWLWLVSVNGGSFLNWGTTYCAVNTGSGATSGSIETCSVSAGNFAAGTTYAFKLQATDSASSPETETSGTSATVAVSAALGTVGAPVANATALDTDQLLGITGTLSATGGTAPLAWTWEVSVNSGAYAAATQCTVNGGSGDSNGAPVACDIAAHTLTAGSTYTFQLVVTDGATVPETQTSPATASVTVAAALTAPLAPTLSVAIVDLDQALTVSGTLPSTGSPTYAWAWWVSVNFGTYAAASICAVNSGTGAAGATVETCVISPSTLTVGSTYTFELQVMDSASKVEAKTSPASHVADVYSALTAPAAPTASGTAIDSDQALTVTATLASTGTPTYDWTWYVSVNGGSFVASSVCAANGGTGAAGAAKEVCALAATKLVVGDTYAFLIQVTDSASSPETVVSSPTPTISVAAALAVSAISPSAPSLDVGQSVVLSASATGGTSPVSYAWYTGKTCTTAITGATSLTLTVQPSATTSYSFQATDSASTPEVRCSASDTVTVNAALKAGNISASATTLDVGQSSVLTAQSTGGTDPLSYQWYSGTDATCASNTLLSGATGKSYTVSPSATTSYCYVVTDSAKVAETGSSQVLTITVDPDPAVTVPSASPGSVDVGQTVTFSTVGSGGTGALTYTWNVSKGLGCAASKADTVSCTPTLWGTYTIRVNATDTVHGVAPQESTTYVVYSDPAVLTPTASLATPEVGAAEEFVTNATGGFGARTLTWTGLPAGCSGAGQTVYCVPKAAVGLSVSVSVVDANGFVDTSSALALTVVPALGPVTVSASTTSLGVGQTVDISATVSGGVAPYTAVWTGTPTGCTFSDPLSLSCVPTTTGSYSIVVNATDADGASIVSSPTLVTVTGSSSGGGGGGLSGLSGSSLTAVAGGAVVAVLVVLLLLWLLVRHRRQGGGDRSAPPAAPMAGNTTWAPHESHLEPPEGSVAPPTPTPEPAEETKLFPLPEAPEAEPKGPD